MPPSPLDDSELGDTFLARSLREKQMHFSHCFACETNKKSHKNFPLMAMATLTWGIEE
jgi:hypothetical protein